MATFINVNFYGHDDPVVSGLLAGVMPDAKHKGTVPARQFKRRFFLNAVGFTPIPNVEASNWNAILGPTNANGAAAILDTIMGAKTWSKPVFLVTGYSSGGITAIFFSQAVNRRGDAELYYLGLGDAAFMRGESDRLMAAPGVTAKYCKNYFQTKENDDKNPEIHNAVAGFANFNLDAQVTGHDQAVTKGNDMMSNDIIWCRDNYPK